MSSTSSTGHHLHTIQFEQPSSSGETMSMTSGCQMIAEDGAVIKHSSGSFEEYSSGAYINLKNKAYMDVNANAYVDFNAGSYQTLGSSAYINLSTGSAYIKKAVVAHSSLNATLDQSAINVVTSATSDIVFYLPVLTDEGMETEIISYTTFAWLLKGITKKVYFGSTLVTNHQLTLIGTTLTEKYGLAITLRSFSTQGWQIMSIYAGGSTYSLAFAATT